METSLKSTPPSGGAVPALQEPHLSPTEHLVWALLHLDPRLTRRTEQPRLRRLARLLDQSEEAFLIALERIRAWTFEGRLDPAVFKTRLKSPPPARRAAIALAELLAQCGGARLPSITARRKLAELMGTIGYSAMIAEPHAYAVEFPSLPNLGPPATPSTWPRDARSCLGLGNCTLKLSPGKMRVLALLRLDPRLSHPYHADRLLLLMIQFDPGMEPDAIARKVKAWRMNQSKDPVLLEIFGHRSLDDPPLSEVEPLVDSLGFLCGWNLLPPDARLTRRHRALLLLGHP